MSLRRRLRGRGLTSRADVSMVNLGGGPVVAIAVLSTGEWDVFFRGKGGERDCCCRWPNTRIGDWRREMDAGADVVR